LNYQKFEYDPATIDVVCITHSHADHIGRLPKLYHDGFRGQILATDPTSEITKVALPDTLQKIGQEAHDNGHPVLYTPEDVEKVGRLFTPIPYATPLKLAEGLMVTFHDASHILGSAMVEFVVTEEGTAKRIVFSGDLGNPPTVLLNPIDYVKDADYALIEAAYGNRIHEDRSKRRDKLLTAIKDTVKRGGVLMIPSFAIERTQELLLELDQLFEKGELPKVPIFVDSPLATKMTQVYGRFSSYFNPAAIEVLKDNRGLFEFPWLEFTHSVEDSKAINDVPSPKIIIAGSGMSQGGRILHHESRYLSDPASTILFVGYQVQGSLGRRILDGAKEVSVLGQSVTVRCHVEAIGAYSAHADQNGLVEYVRHANEGRGLKQVFIVQGEGDASAALADRIHKDLGVEAIVPTSHQTFSL
jgi:metallo-beta-lactamase family protein